MNAYPSVQLPRGRCPQHFPACRSTQDHAEHTSASSHAKTAQTVSSRCQPVATRVVSLCFGFFERPSLLRGGFAVSSKVVAKPKPSSKRIVHGRPGRTWKQYAGLLRQGLTSRRAAQPCRPRASLPCFPFFTWSNRLPSCPAAGSPTANRRSIFLRLRGLARGSPFLLVEDKRSRGLMGRFLSVTRFDADRE
jgi:hypothetical protein